MHSGVCSTNTPVCSSIIESTHPVTRAVIIGNYIEEASNVDIPKPSLYEGKTKTFIRA